MNVRKKNKAVHFLDAEAATEAIMNAERETARPGWAAWSELGWTENKYNKIMEGGPVSRKDLDHALRVFRIPFVYEYDESFGE